MSDFFTHLAGLVIQPSTDVIPNIPLRFAPGANVPGSELASEPPVLDTLLQPAPADSANRMGADQSSPTLVDALVIPKALAAGANLLNPAVSGTQFLPDHPKAEKDYPAAEKGPGVENTAPALAPAPHETRPNPSLSALPAESNELPRTPARPSVAQPSPVVVPSVGLPMVRPADRPETPFGQPLSASPVADPEGPGATGKLPIPIVRPESSLSPLEPLEPPLGQPSSAAPRPVRDVPKPPASSDSQPEPLASPAAGEIAQPNQSKTGAKFSAAVIQEPLPQASQRAAAKSLPEILPLIKPAAAQMILTAASLSPAASLPSSPGVRRAAAETAIPQVRATLPAAAISPQTPDADSPELILAAPLPYAGSSGQAQSVQRQTQPALSAAGPQPAPSPAVDPGPIETAGPASPAAQRLPGTPDPRPAPKREMAAEQPLFLPELNSKSFIRPVLGAESLLDSAALSSRSSADEQASPTVHLTIGRIVVRAAPPAVPATSRPAPIRRQPAVSLHDYLNRHGGDK